MTVLALVLAAITGIALVLFGRRGDPDRTRRCKCEGCRTGLPEDGGPLSCWEWDELDRIQDFYARTARDPMTRTRRSAARRSK